MDWFKRYGIPGAYFLSLMVGWMYALYQCWPFNLELDDLAKLGVFLFLPVGYILSILGQFRYLGSPAGGLHCKAAKRVIPPFVKGEIKLEPDIEALSCLNAATSDLGTPTSKNPINLEAHKFIQEWIRKRMDVVVINNTIVLATWLALFGAFIIGILFSGFRLQCEPRFVILFGLISFVVLLIMCGCRRTLQEQITIVIAGAWLAIPNKKKFKTYILQQNKKCRYPRIIFFLFRPLSSIWTFCLKRRLERIKKKVAKGY
ncbi:MAG: hypothetical protein KAT05_03430, partial [Spirochaetes bacterium]|nr:hypothetical protein [Spirochaetota bacterium]